MKNTIKLHRDFNFEGAGSAVTPSMIAKYRKKLHDTGEFGLVVSKKVFPRAVQRNRAKRLMREWIRKCKMPGGLDILLIARPQIMKTSLPEGVRHMKSVIRRVKGQGLVSQ
jgi:ribonuclease P protein component